MTRRPRSLSRRKKAAAAPATRMATRPVLGRARSATLPTMGHVPKMICTATSARCGSIPFFLFATALLNSRPGNFKPRRGALTVRAGTRSRALAGLRRAFAFLRGARVGRGRACVLALDGLAVLRAVFLALGVCGDVGGRLFRFVRAHRLPREQDLSEQVERVLQNLLEGLEELRAGRAVNDAVVAGHRDAHQLADDDLAVADDRAGRHRADGEDGGLRRVDDRRELVYAEHAEVADGEGRAGVLFGLELAAARALGQPAHLAGDLADRLRVRPAHHGRYQPVLDGDGDADVGALEVAKRLLLEGGIDRRVLHERDRRDFDDEVVETDLVFGIEFVQLAAHLRRPVHLDLGRQEEVRDGADGGDEASRNRRPHRRHRLFVIRRSAFDCWRERRRGGGRRRLCGRLRGARLDLRRGGLRLLLCCLQRLLDVALHDATAGAAPREVVEFDARLGGHARRDGRDDEASRLRSPTVARRLRTGLRLTCGGLCSFARAWSARLRRGRSAAHVALERLPFDRGPRAVAAGDDARQLVRRSVGAAFRRVFDSLFLLGLRRAGRGFGDDAGDVFVGLADDGDDRAQGNCLALFDKNLPEHALGERLRLHRRLVGVHLGQRLADAHLVALFL